LIGFGEQGVKNEGSKNQHVYSFQKFMSNPKSINDGESSLEEKIANIISSLEEDDDGISSKDLITKPLGCMTFPLEQIEITNENNSEGHDLSNAVEQTKPRALWDEFNVQDDDSWFLPFIKHCSVRIEKLFLKICVFQSISKKQLDSLASRRIKVQKPKLNTVKVKKTRNKTEKPRKEQNRNKRRKEEKKVSKINTKNISTKTGKRKKLSSKEVQDDDTIFDLKLSKRDIIQKTKLSETPTHPALKSILVSNKKKKAKEDTKSHRKVSFCTSIFIRKFQVDSDSESEYEVDSD
jgi:hypothetical protein